MHRNKSPNIFNTSAYLFGLCFIILTSLKVKNALDGTLVDELTPFGIMVFMTGCIFFLSTKNKTQKGEPSDDIADKLFIGTLLMLSMIAIYYCYSYKF